MNFPCGPDPELWFSDHADDQAAAKRICAGCPDRADCLQKAQGLESGLAAPARYGIWGGLDPKERAKADPNKRRRRSTPVCGTNAGYNAHVQRGDEKCEPCKAAHRDAERVRLGKPVVAARGYWERDETTTKTGAAA